MHRLINLIKSDNFRLRLLEIVTSLNLPDCFIAAGFVRNLVWDYLHNYQGSALNDVDVIYYNNSDVSEMICKKAGDMLRSKAPEVNWQIKNQALMHIRNNDRVYINSTDAMTFWPEKETAIGVQLDKNGSIIVSAPFGVESLFQGKITYNPKRDKAIFLERVRNKQWLQKWPKLQVVL